jgi:hypothetical protein
VGPRAAKPGDQFLNVNKYRITHQSASYRCSGSTCWSVVQPMKSHRDYHLQHLENKTESLQTYNLNLLLPGLNYGLSEVQVRGTKS